MKTQAILVLLAAVVLIAFGLACVNYSKPSTLDHHREWALEHDAPPPSDLILIGGVASVSAGVLLLTLVMTGRGSRGSRPA